MPPAKQLSFETAFVTYRVVGNVRSGGAAKVYRTRTDTGEEFAVKVLDAERLTSERLKRFKNEAMFGQRHPHANLVAVVDHGLVTVNRRALPFFVMPYFEHSLRDAMSRNLITPERVLPVFSQILDGIEAAHFFGAVHRDLKPENILCSSDLSRVVIADFGIAHFSTDDLATLVETNHRSKLANFQYAAPEQRMRGRRMDNRTDIYSLGLILNELVTGQIAHGTEYRSVASVAPHLAFLDPVVAEMLRQDPSGRPDSIGVIKASLHTARNQFFEKQRLDELQRTVVPASTLTDPLLSNPPELVGVEWKEGFLFLKLSPTPSIGWIQAFQRIGNFTGFMGRGPATVSFAGDTARMQCQGHEAQQTINYFKSWLPTANRDYRENLQNELNRTQQKERERLEREVERARVHIEVNQNLKV
jgi:serine/threonine protein kinase